VTSSDGKEKEKKGKKEGGIFSMFGEKEKKGKKDKRGSEVKGMMGWCLFSLFLSFFLLLSFFF
jgi:hypothetical protein